MGYLIQLLLVAAFLQPVSAECRLVTRGLSRDLILLGTVLTPEGAQPDAAVFVQAGLIAHVGDLGGLGTRGRDASVLDCRGGGGSVLSPGFINTHEHIAFSALPPFPNTGERVSHRHDWRLGARNRTVRPAVLLSGSEGTSTAWGELRHLFAGTTSVIGGAMAPGLARNLDFAEGLGADLDAGARGAVLYDTFPLRDAHGVMREGDCDYGAEGLDRAVVARYRRYIGHVGEGVDAAAANEFACLSNATYDTVPVAGAGGLSTDIMGPNVALVHALGLSARDFGVVAARGAKVVWSPRSNMALYGRTLDVGALLAAGITVALGTDWLPSGSATMAREAVCAAQAAYQGYGVRLAPRVLWEMATVNAAVVAGFEDRLGALEVGKLGDVVVFGEVVGEGGGDPFAQAIFAPQERVELVLRGGKILLASAEIRDLTSEECEVVAFGASDKIVCVADELGSSFKEFEASLGGGYPAVLPDVPPDEPTCKPL
ncbi:metal dependent amidohydrolase [Hypoxylon argillaceum]|nr:metal dependent amidohydrolase [Hypoxylon argillaceum]